MPLERIVKKLANVTKNTFRQFSNKAISYIPKIKVIKEIKEVSDYLKPSIHSQYKIQEKSSDSISSTSDLSTYEQSVHEYDIFKFNETLIEHTPTGSIKQGKYYKNIYDEMRTRGMILSYINNSRDMY